MLVLLHAAGKEYRMRKFEFAMCHPGRSLWRLIGSIAILALAIALVACGDDSGTSANDGDGGSEAAMTSSSRHSGPDPESSSSKTVSSSSVKKESSSSSVAPASSSSKKVESSSSQKIASSSSSVKTASSSSSVIPASSGNLPSSSSKKDGGSSSAMTSSSSSSKKESSSSEYVPFDHSWTLASFYEVGKDAYKQFTDTRNGRSYYYITITSTRKETMGKSVTVMAENLNIGEMVHGKKDQSDDSKIEKYCYANDTTKCDEFGGLYQWAEMMQLPSRCNTESCSDLIQENHRGICPEGWRLFTWDDYEIVRGYDDKFDDGIKGLRSTYRFRGTNQSGFSLTGAGFRKKNGGFGQIEDAAYWFYPEEAEYDVAADAYKGYVSASVNDGPKKDDVALKVLGQSVRCTKLE